MEKWRYKSLEWIHKIREDNYNKTKDSPHEEILEKVKENTHKLINDLNLRIISPSETIPGKRTKIKG